MHRSTPFRPPHRGRQAVRDYVTQAFADEQRIDDVRLGTPVVQGDRACVEYWASFLDQHGTAMTLAGCAMAQFDDDGLITEARDHWHLQEGQDRQAAEFMEGLLAPASSSPTTRAASAPAAAPRRQRSAARRRQRRRPRAHPAHHRRAVAQGRRHQLPARGDRLLRQGRSPARQVRPVAGAVSSHPARPLCRAGCVLHGSPCPAARTEHGWALGEFVPVSRGSWARRRP